MFIHYDCHLFYFKIFNTIYYGIMEWNMPSSIFVIQVINLNLTVILNDDINLAQSFDFSFHFKLQFIYEVFKCFSHKWKAKI